MACSFIVWKLLDTHELMNNAVPTTLSRLTPPIDYFNEFVDRQDHYDHFKLMDCIYYHKAVAQFYPIQKSESYGMLGFCYERLGQQAQAVDSYKQAIAANPDYFWPYYDLGVIFYNQAKYAQAEDYFHQAIARDPVRTIVLLNRSKVYNDVKLSKQDGRYDFLAGFKQGRVTAYILLMDCLYKTGSYAQLWKAATNGIDEGVDTQGVFYYYAGLAAFNLKSFPNAIFFLQNAAQRDPTNADAYYYLGQCLRVAGKEDMAGMFLAKVAGLHHQGYTGIKKYLEARVSFF